MNVEEDEHRQEAKLKLIRVDWKCKTERGDSNFITPDAGG